jgi:hypothetical protein
VNLKRSLIVIVSSSTSAFAGQGENLEEASYNKSAFMGCAPCASGAAWRLPDRSDELIAG